MPYILERLELFEFNYETFKLDNMNSTFFSNDLIKFLKTYDEHIIASIVYRIRVTKKLLDKINIIGMIIDCSPLNNYLLNVKIKTTIKKSVSMPKLQLIQSIQSPIQSSSEELVNVHSNITTPKSLSSEEKLIIPIQHMCSIYSPVQNEDYKTLRGRYTFKSNNSEGSISVTSISPINKSTTSKESNEIYVSPNKKEVVKKFTFEESNSDEETIDITNVSPINTSTNITILNFLKRLF